MAEVQASNISCGVDQLFDLDKEPKDTLVCLGDNIFEDGGKIAFVAWSDIWGKNKRGSKLYHYIRKQFPKSQVVRTKKGKNPNNGNQICVYIWKIPRNFKKWYSSHSPEESNGEWGSNNYYPTN